MTIKILITILTLAFNIGGNTQVEKPNELKITTESNINNLDQVNSLFTAQGNTVKINEENLTLNFSSDYVINGGTISFGPKGFIPESPTDGIYEMHYYSMNLIDKRSLADIYAEVEAENQNFVSLTPTEIEIAGLSGLKWSIGGMCESRIIELLGENNNIQFYSTGCHTDFKEEDFKYFEELFEY